MEKETDLSGKRVQYRRSKNLMALFKEQIYIFVSYVNLNVEGKYDWWWFVRSVMQVLCQLRRRRLKIAKVKSSRTQSRQMFRDTRLAKFKIERAIYEMCDLNFSQTVWARVSPNLVLDSIGYKKAATGCVCIFQGTIIKKSQFKIAANARIIFVCNNQVFLNRFHVQNSQTGLQKKNVDMNFP